MSLADFHHFSEWTCSFTIISVFLLARQNFMVDFQIIHARVALLAVLHATIQHQRRVIAAPMYLELSTTNIMV